LLEVLKLDLDRTQDFCLTLVDVSMVSNDERNSQLWSTLGWTFHCLSLPCVYAGTTPTNWLLDIMQ